MSEKLRECANPLCDYWLAGGAAYCCGGCALAHERKYEIHEDGPLGHGLGCARRGPDGSLAAVPHEGGAAT